MLAHPGTPRTKLVQRTVRPRGPALQHTINTYQVQQYCCTPVPFKNLNQAPFMHNLNKWWTWVDCSLLSNRRLRHALMPHPGGEPCPVLVCIYCCCMYLNVSRTRYAKVAAQQNQSRSSSTAINSSSHSSSTAEPRTQNTKIKSQSCILAYLI